MRSFFAVLAVLVSSSSLAEPGFFPLSSREVPKKVADAAKNTFRVYFFRERAHAVVKSASVPRLKKLLQDEPLATLDRLGLAKDGLLAKVLLKDIDGLKEGADLELRSGGVGSAFFVAPGWLLTVRHALAHGVLPKSYWDATTAKDARAAILEWKGRLVLIDADGKIRFDSWTTGQRLENVGFSGHPVEASALPPRYDKIEKSAKGQMLDLVALSLKGIDPKDFYFEVAKDAPRADDRLYAAGYPLRTTRKMGETAPDADGESLRVSHGKAFLEAPDDYRNFLKKLMEDEPRKLYESSLIYSDADFVPGLSGGPYLNAEGQLVSLASTVRHDPKVPAHEKYTVTASYGPKLSLLIPLLGK